MASNTRLTDRKLRQAMEKIVTHARAEPGSTKRLTKEELMKQIDILDGALADFDWTVYYP